MIKRTARIVLLLSLLLIAAASYAVFQINSMLNTPYQGYNIVPLWLTIPPGSSVDAIIRILEENGVVKHGILLKGIFRLRGTQGQVKAGDYVFDRPLSLQEVYEKLLKGELRYIVFTIAEGVNLYDLESIFANRGICTIEEFRSAAQSPLLLNELRRIDPSILSVEGFLFPETYYITKKDSAKKILLTMTREFKKRFGPAEVARARELGMTVIEAVTLASLIEKETGEESERPLISGVFHNRLRRSMLLQCDPTVIYALQLLGEYKGYLTRDDLKKRSPYNTYVSAGLPPGPICNPGKASLTAALYPQQTDKLYFVSKNDGTHHFSATLQEHNRAVRIYQR